MKRRKFKLISISQWTANSDIIRYLFWSACDEYVPNNVLRDPGDGVGGGVKGLSYVAYAGTLGTVGPLEPPPGASVNPNSKPSKSMQTLLDLWSAAVVSKDGSVRELEPTADGQALLVALDDSKQKETNEDDKLVILQTAVAGGGLLATVFSLTGTDETGSTGCSHGLKETGGLPRPESAATEPPVLDSSGTTPIAVKESSAVVSGTGSNLLGADPTKHSVTLQNDKTIAYPNLVVVTSSQSVAVFDRAFEGGNVGHEFKYVVGTSEGVTNARTALVGLSGISAKPDVITPGVVSEVFANLKGFEGLALDDDLEAGLQNEVAVPQQLVCRLSIVFRCSR